MTYRQYCALARSLDVVGDRWTLLIVRELLAGPRRYGELRSGLPGIASNLLAQRLRRLEADGIIAKQGAEYRLTTRGQALRGAVRELIRWGEPLMLSGQGSDHFSAHWLIPALDALLVPGERARVDLQVGGGTVHIVSDGDQVVVGPGSSVGADAEIEGPPEVLLGICAGHIELAAALEQGLVSCSGDSAVPEALFRRVRTAGGGARVR